MTSGPFRTGARYLAGKGFTTPLSRRVLERRHRLDGVPGCTDQSQLAVCLSELIDRNGDIMLGDAQKSPNPNDRVRDCFGWRNDDVVDCADLLVLFIVDRLGQNLLLRAPARGYFAQFGCGDAD